MVSVRGEKRVRTNEMGAGKEYGRRRNRAGGERREEGVKREREGKGTRRRESGEGDEKRSRQ